MLAAAPAVMAQFPAPQLRAADPLHLVFVVEDGGRQVSLLDGKRMELVHRFAPRLPVQGAPKFTADGQFAFFGSAQGWVVKYDLRSLAVAAEVRAGSAFRSLAQSADDRLLLVANAAPATLALFDSQLRPVRSYPAATLDGQLVSPALDVHDTGPRRSFVVAFDALPQLWEISYDPAAGPIFDGLVHDYRMGEAIATPGFLGARRTPLESPVDLVTFDLPHRHVLASPRSREGTAPARRPLQVINLDIRRRIVELPLNAASADLAASFTRQGRPMLAIAATADGGVSIVDAASWRVLQTVRIGGRAIFVRAHPGAPQLWVGSEAEDPEQPATLTLVDRQALAVAAVLTVPGRSLASMAFSRDGRGVMVGLGGEGNALLVYDTATLKLLRTLPTPAAPVAYPVSQP